MILKDVEDLLEAARAAGADDNTPVVVGDKRDHLDINDIKVGLHEPRTAEGTRITSIRKIFIT